MGNPSASARRTSSGSSMLKHCPLGAALDGQQVPEGSDGRVTALPAGPRRGGHPRAPIHRCGVGWTLVTGSGRSGSGRFDAAAAALDPPVGCLAGQRITVEQLCQRREHPRRRVGQMADLAPWKRQQQLAQRALVRGRDARPEIDVGVSRRRENQHSFQLGPARRKHAVGAAPPAAPAVLGIGVGQTGIERAAVRPGTQSFRQRRVGEPAIAALRLPDERQHRSIVLRLRSHRAQCSVAPSRLTADG